jgi:hypothetical protein
LDSSLNDAFNEIENHTIINHPKNLTSGMYDPGNPKIKASLTKIESRNNRMNGIPNKYIGSLEKRNRKYKIKT